MRKRGISKLAFLRSENCSLRGPDNREIKFDVTWPHVNRQTAKMTSEFVFFSSNPSLNHIKIEKCLLLIATNRSIFTLLFNVLKTDGKSFIFAVCRLTYDHVTSNLISLIYEYILCCFLLKSCSCWVLLTRRHNYHKLTLSIKYFFLHLIGLNASRVSKLKTFHTYLMEICLPFQNRFVSVE